MKEKEVKTARPNPSVCDLIVNTSYMTALTLELFIREVEMRLAVEEARIQKEKKLKYTRFLECTKKALYWAEELTQDIFEVDAENKWKNIPIWQEESNELARLILLYADRSATKENIDKVFKMLRELPGEGIVTEDVLKRFKLQKNND